MSEHWSRRNVIATIVVGVLTCTVTFAVYFFNSRDQEIDAQAVMPSESSEKQLQTVSIFSIHVSEVAMDIPAAFELGVQVGGISNLAALELDIILDFGRAEIDTCDYTPKSAITNVVASDKSHRRLEIAELRQKEKLYIRCLISSPVFEQVIISGDNIVRGISIDFKQYQASLQSEPDEAVGFWAVIGYGFVIFFSIVFCFKVIGFLFPNF